jgi:putative endonuclease
MYFIYILYSPSSDMYYVGYTNHLQRRLDEHNNSAHTTYTSKHRPWQMAAVFQCGVSAAEAMQLERFIKRQKSRRLIEQLCNPAFIPSGKLAQLVSVPHLRD